MEKSEALGREKKALGEKTAALDRVLRLADSKKVRELLDEMDTLWPLHPDKAADMAAWIERASALLKNRQDHHLALSTLRQYLMKVLFYSLRRYLN